VGSRISMLIAAVPAFFAEGSAATYRSKA